MGILNNTVLDCEGNKIQNIEDEHRVNRNQIGNQLWHFEILQIINKQEENQKNLHLVFKVRSLINKKIYSIKQYQNFNNSNIQQYFQKLISINHPHIVKYYNYFYEQSENQYYLIMEYINNLDIFCFIQAQRSLKKDIPEIEIWNILLQCSSALEYIKNLNDGDSNVKLELINIFINNEKNAKIALLNNDTGFPLGNNYENQNLYTLWNYFYSMINPEFEPFISDKGGYNIFINIQQNLGYSQELQNVLINIYKKSNPFYNFDNINPNYNIYNEIKNE
jgi:hypothetical protein